MRIVLAIDVGKKICFIHFQATRKNLGTKAMLSDSLDGRKFLSVAEMAKIAGIAEQTIRNMMSSDRWPLRRFSFGRRVLTSADEFEVALVSGRLGRAIKRQGRPRKPSEDDDSGGVAGSSISSPNDGVYQEPQTAAEHEDGLPDGDK